MGARVWDLRLFSLVKMKKWPFHGEKFIKIVIFVIFVRKMMKKHEKCQKHEKHGWGASDADEPRQNSYCLVPRHPPRGGWFLMKNDNFSIDENHVLWFLNFSKFDNFDLLYKKIFKSCQIKLIKLDYKSLS